MSVGSYAAWSLLTAGILAAIGFVGSRIVKYLRWAEYFHARKSQILHDRLAAALARPPSRYFEDPPTIEREIAAHEAAAVSVKQRFPAMRVALVVVLTIWCGFGLAGALAQPVLGVDAPKWPDNLTWIWMPALGLIYVLQSLEPSAEYRTSSRVIGIAYLAMGVLQLTMMLVGAA